jgi:hypothetical protein
MTSESDAKPMLDVPLADLQDAILEPETLRQLLFDIETQAQLIEIRVKGGATAQASAGVRTLSAARSLLESGGVLGVQLRYRWRGFEWWDTLMRSAAGIRLVRIQHRT